MHQNRNADDMQQPTAKLFFEKAHLFQYIDIVRKNLSLNEFDVYAQFHP